MLVLLSQISDKTSVTAFSPATCSNLAVGFDILGCALEGIGDTVTLQRRDDNQLMIAEITGQESCRHLPKDSDSNAATVVLMKLLSDHDCQAGFTVHINKGIP